MRPAVAEQTRDTAGCGIGVLAGSILSGFLILERQLVLHFVGDHLLDLRGQHRLGGGSGGRSAVGLLRLLVSSIGSLQVLRDDVVGEPEGCRGVYGVRSKVIAEVTVPGIACPSPSEGDRNCPGIIGPSIEPRAIVEGGGVDVVISAAVAVVAAVVTVVLVAMVVVGPPAKIVAMVAVATLDVSGPSALDNNAAVVGALHLDSASAPQVMVDIHAAPCIVHIAHTAAGTGANCVAAFKSMFVASGRSGTVEGSGLASDAGMPCACSSAHMAGVGRTTGVSGGRTAGLAAIGRWPFGC